MLPLILPPVAYRYGDPENDGQWWHWNHEYLANWDQTDRNKYPTGAHQPPEDIGANFYPSLGAYSSTSEPVIRQHMAWIRQVGLFFFKGVLFCLGLILRSSYR